jgi:hypothetical protein
VPKLNSACREDPNEVVGLIYRNDSKSVSIGKQNLLIFIQVWTIWHKQQTLSTSTEIVDPGSGLKYSLYQILEDPTINLGLKYPFHNYGADYLTTK